LPKPIAVSGQVLVGGVAPSRRTGAIKVFAEWQGEDFLKPHLNVQTTADADGNFFLGGMTPGDYVIQAALDSIWLSSPVIVHTGRGRLGPVRLKIPPPGAPLRLELRDQSGTPVLGSVVTIRHRGPLAWLWPREWVSDALGNIDIPTLEAGTKFLQLAGVAQPLHLKVPPLPADPLTVRIRVARTK
jgi:hypothetical protein